MPNLKKTEVIVKLSGWYWGTNSLELKLAIIKGVGEIGGEDAINKLSNWYIGTNSKELKAEIAIAIGRAARDI